MSSCYRTQIMKFRPLPQGLAQRMIEGVEDELTPRSDARLAKIKSMQCPRCGSAMSPQLYAPQVFVQHEPLPRVVAYCQDCGSTIDPETNIVLSTGDGRRVEEALPLIKG